MQAPSDASAPARSASYPPPAVAWWGLAVLFIVYTVSYIDRTVISLLVTPIKRDLTLSDTQMSLLLGGAFAIFYVLAALPLGRLADRYNRKWLIIGAVMFWSLATASCGLAGSFVGLFMARVAVGVGEATLSPCAMSMIADYFPREKLGRAISLFAMGTPAGSGLALVGGSAVIGMVGDGMVLPVLGDTPPWRLVFMAMLAPGALVLLLLITLREPARLGAKGEDASYAELFRFLWRNPGVLAINLGMMALYVPVQGCLPWLPSFFERSYGIPAHEIGVRLGVLAVICGPIGLLTGGVLTDYLFRKRVLTVHVMIPVTCALLLTPIAILIPLAPSAELALAGLVAQVVLTFLPIGASVAGIQMVTPNRLRGRMSAMNLLLTGLGALAIGPSVIAVINDTVFGREEALRYAISITAAIFAPMAVVILLAGRASFRRQVSELLAVPQG